MNLLVVQSPSVKTHRVHCENKSFPLPLSLDGGMSPDNQGDDEWCDRLPTPPVSPWERTGFEFPPAALEELSRRSNQNLFYTSEKAQLLRNSFDVGVVWPTRGRYGSFADSQRPPTRLHFWMAHGVPAVGYPMQAYTDTAGRTGYPHSLLNVTSAAMLTQALLLVRPAKVRRCLQRRERAAAAATSPLASAYKLLAMLFNSSMC